MVSLLLIAATFVPFTPVTFLPILSLLSLAVPVLVIANMLVMILWLVRKKWFFIFSLLSLILCYIFLGTFYKIRLKGHESRVDDLKILSYNTRAFNRYNWIDKPGIPSSIKEFVIDQDADIVCFQEFDRKQVSEFSFYPFHYVHGAMEKENREELAIFSKFPIIGNGYIDFPESENNAIYADIKVYSDTLRIYNVHLESLRLIPSTTAISEEPSKKLLKRLTASFSKQHSQAALLRQHMDATNYMKLLCADFNNSPFSKVYKDVKEDMEDSFDIAGSGYGRTYNFLNFPVRIDFILVDRSLEITGHSNYDIQLSDHYPVSASVRIINH